MHQNTEAASKQDSFTSSKFELQAPGQFYNIDDPRESKETNSGESVNGGSQNDTSNVPSQAQSKRPSVPVSAKRKQQL